MPPVTIRSAGTGDLDALLALWRALEDAQSAFRVFPMIENPEHRVIETFRAAITDVDARVLVAEDDGSIVGMAIATYGGHHGLSDASLVELSRVVVAPDRRSRRIGTALVDAAASFGRERGAMFLVAKSFSGNEAARRFWERLGFTPRYEERVRPILPTEDEA